MNVVDLALETASPAEHAVEFANTRFRTRLDFSQDGLKKVKEILDTLSHSIARGLLAKLRGRGRSQDEVVAMSALWGSYVGEVIRRRWVAICWAKGALV